MEENKRENTPLRWARNGLPVGDQPWSLNPCSWGCPRDVQARPEGWRKWVQRVLDLRLGGGRRGSSRRQRHCSSSRQSSCVGDEVCVVEERRLMCRLMWRRRRGLGRFRRSTRGTWLHCTLGRSGRWRRSSLLLLHARWHLRRRSQRVDRCGGGTVASGCRLGRGAREGAARRRFRRRARGAPRLLLSLAGRRFDLDACAVG